MKLKYKVLIGALVVACLCLLVNSFRVGSRVNYHKGRADQALTDLRQAEEVFELALEQDKELQEEKDRHIAELEEAVAADNREIVIIEKEIVVTRDMLIASGLYQGLVKELDERWTAKYSKLEGVVSKKDKVIKDWEEKFNSKVDVAIRAYIDKDQKQKKALERFQKLCTVQETQIKVLKLKGTVWQWVAIAGGVKIGYDVIRGK